MSALVVGSRGSQLALRQTGQVIDQLSRVSPGVCCRIEVIRTTGDRVHDVPLAKIGDKGLFVKEIEQALLRGEIDFAVHSAKDLPSEMDDGLCVAAYPEREEPWDALVSKHGPLANLPAGAVVGTSSIRRRAQLLNARPDLRVADLRGNLDTRLRKLDNGDYDAVLLACAGLRRMGWESRISEALPPDVCLPAVGQGALAVQCRTGDSACDTIGVLDHPATRRCVSAERALLAALGAGCQTPVAAFAREIDGAIRLDAAVMSPDGSNLVRRSLSGGFGDSEEIGRRVAKLLLDSPAGELLEDARRGVDLKGMGAA